MICESGYNGGMPQTFVIEVHQQRYYDDFVKKYRDTSMDSNSLHGSSTSDVNIYGYDQILSGTTTTLGGMTPLPPSPITRLEMTQEPRFNLQNLSPGTAFTLVIYAKNEKVGYCRLFYHIRNFNKAKDVKEVIHLFEFIFCREEATVS